MAILRNGILGGFKGKIGPATGSSWRKLYIVKSRSGKKIKKKDLLPQNFKLKVISTFFGNFSKLVKIGFYHKRNKDSPYNRAVHHNLRQALTGDAPNYIINYKKIIFSKGNREPVWSGKAILAQDNQIKISWEIPETAKLKVIGNDQAIVAVYNETKKKAAGFFVTAARLDLSVTVTIQKVFIGHTFHVWMFFVSPDGKSTSNSDYLGSV
jgi:hypothetical protein